MLKKTKKKLRNYGLNLKRQQEELSDKDYIFGGLSKACLTAKMPIGERGLNLPQGELQNIGEEKFDCVSRMAINILETKINWLLKENKLSVENTKWLNDNGYITIHGFSASDAYIAIKSGTTREGNSLKAPLRAIENWGLIPKKLMPQLATWEEHHDLARITAKIEALGLEFRKRFTINYEKVYEQDYPNLIQKDLLGVGGYAWPVKISGEYGKSSYSPNHAFMVYQPLYYAFDNYIEDGIFIKKLSRDYDFVDYGYRLFIASEQVKKLSWFQRLLEWLKIC